jgi:putative DNA primase/helicase
LPPRQGDDFNDLLLREGAEAVRATIQAALDGNSAGDADRPVETGCNLPIGFVEPSGSLPALRADEGDLAQATDQAWAVLLDSNRPPGCSAPAAGSPGLRSTTRGGRSWCR